MRPGDLPDNFTLSLYKVAPYRGCAHGCRYCDGRAEKYYVEGDFERDVEIRESIPVRFAAELPALRERGMLAFGSGVTDPYQPLEAERRLTGRCAEALAAACGGNAAPAEGRSHAGAGSAPERAEARTPGQGEPPSRRPSGGNPALFDEAPSPNPLPALVMTKSALALRDLPAWRKVNEAAGFVLLVSITSLDEELREVMEPGASSFADRLALLRAYKEAGCAVGALAMPFLPGLSDGEASIERLYAALAALPVDFAMPGGLTLRPGRQKDFYLKALEAYRPDLLPSTLALFAEERASGSPTAAARRELFSRIEPIRRKYELPHLLPHKVFARMLPPHDAFRVLLRDMVELYGERRIDTTALRRGADAYDSWLVGLRREYRRRRSLPRDWVEDRFAAALADGSLYRLLDNPRLASFSASVLEEGARLDFQSLRLE